MAETFDDEIIDLTDLMEEGEPAKKQRRAEEPQPERAGVREPESFDLGKEISLDDELALVTAEPEKTVEPELPPATAAAEEPAPKRPPLEPLGSDEDLEALVKEPTQPTEPPSDFAASKEPIVEELAAGKQRSETAKPLTPPSVSPVFDAFFKETIEEVKIEAEEGTFETRPARRKLEVVETPETLETFEPEAVSAPVKAAEAETSKASAVAWELETGEAAAEPVIPVAPPVSEAPPATPPLEEVRTALRQEMEDKVHAAAEQLRADVPSLLENIVRPVMDDLVREITQTTRDILPGIVEKIIREEIEKLKKID